MAKGNAIALQPFWHPQATPARAAPARQAHCRPWWRPTRSSTRSTGPTRRCRARRTCSLRARSGRSARSPPCRSTRPGKTRSGRTRAVTSTGLATTFRLESLASRTSSSRSPCSGAWLTPTRSPAAAWTSASRRSSALSGTSIPTDEAERAMVDDDKARADFEKRRAIVKEFFEHPDSDRAKFPTFGSWLNAILEDRFVIDAVAIHLVPPRKKGSGPFGSDIAALNCLDGATIRPLLSTRGETPPAPAPAYEQYIYGVPRVDMISVISGNDLQELGEPAANFRADQLIYLRETSRAFTPFGYSLVEKANLPIKIGMARQEWQADYFSEGSVPAQWITAGPDISTPPADQSIAWTSSKCPRRGHWGQAPDHRPSARLESRPGKSQQRSPTSSMSG